MASKALVLVLCGSIARASQLTWTNIQTSLTRDQVDLYTVKTSGCACPYNILDHSCACCVDDGGCHCGRANPSRCGQCGLERYCDNMCNITISSMEVTSRSGQSFGEIKSPPTLSGPAFCWYRLQAEPGERIEVQVYRIKRLGKVDERTKRCMGGSLQFVRGSDLHSRPQDLFICGENERYFPPVVMFHDFPADQAGTSMLLFRVDESTSRSQFLVHYSFTMGDSEERPETNLRMKGGRELREEDLEAGIKYDRSSECDWFFEEYDCLVPGSCQFASPGYPGVYPPNRKCKFLIKTNSKDVDIRIHFTALSLANAQGDCETHYIAIYNGTSSFSPLLQTLCGYQTPAPFDYRSDALLVEFSSGMVNPPINYNGFVAKLEFLGRSAIRERAPDRKKNERNGSPRRPKPTDRSLDDSPSTSKCLTEFYGNETRTGRISSNALSLRNGQCTVVLRGNLGDVILFKLNSFRLKGKSCESSISISVPKNRRERKLIDKICSPAGSKNKGMSYVSPSPLFVNSSVVYIDFQSSRPEADKMDASFDFQHVLSEGRPVPNSTCDTILAGRSGLSKGTLAAQGDSHLFWDVDGPLRCATALVPADAQSITLTLQSMSRPRSGCETRCDSFGCHCDSRDPLHLVDHLVISAFSGGRIACMCGNFAPLLPLELVSTSSIVITYNVAHFRRSDKSFRYSADYTFNREETCGRRHITSVRGVIASPRIERPYSSPNALTFFHQECQWFFDIPPSEKLVVKISTRDRSVPCSQWNATIAIWNRQSGNPIGTVIDQFCPETRAKEYVLNITKRKIVISLNSLSTTTIDYQINWDSSSGDGRSDRSDPDIRDILTSTREIQSDALPGSDVMSSRTTSGGVKSNAVTSLVVSCWIVVALWSVAQRFC